MFESLPFIGHRDRQAIIPQDRGRSSATQESPTINPLTFHEIHDAIVDREIDRSAEALEKLKKVMSEESARLAALGSNKTDEVIFSADIHEVIEKRIIVDFTSDQNPYIPLMDYQV